MKSKQWARFAGAVLVVGALAGVAPSEANAQGLEAYGRLPSLEDVSLSPDGERIAFVRTQGEERIVAATQLADGKVLAQIRVGAAKLRGLDWADRDHLLVYASHTASPPIGLEGATTEWRQLLVLDVATGKTMTVPDSDELLPVRTLNIIIGRAIVRRIDDRTMLFLRAVNLGRPSRPMLVRVDVASGREWIVRKGISTSEDWLVDEAGDVVAESWYDAKTRKWSIRAPREGDLRNVLSGSAEIEHPVLAGFGPDSSTALVQFPRAGGEAQWKLLSLRDGALEEVGAERGNPLHERSGSRLVGFVRSEDDLRYEFLDPRLRDGWKDVERLLPGAHLRLASASEDFSRLVVRVEDGRHGLVYEFIDLRARRASVLGAVYEGIGSVLPVRRIEYAAADGLVIPAYLTLPPARPADRLPLVVLPHGGPAARDDAEFDWLSQALASQGYAVLRPNYRGSALRREFLEAGFGQFGRKMQTDLSDGVRHLVAQGTVDPARVCIVGASYGGYAALAGATLDPGPYRCAVAIAGISDLSAFLSWINWKHLNYESVAARYWDRFLGVEGPRDPALAAISPALHAEAARVPVLLIHGRDDTVVPFEQSEIMHDALSKAGRKVDLVELEAEDHWLSRGATRLRMLQATVEFLRVHNPPDAPTANASADGPAGQ